MGFEDQMRVEGQLSLNVGILPQPGIDGASS